MDHICPKCGKQMAEEPKFKGYWMCPDGKVLLSDFPPYIRKCDGSELTQEGAADLEDELMRQWTNKNKSN